MSVPRGSTVTSTSLFISLPSKWVRGAALHVGYSRVGAHCTKYTCQMLDSGNHLTRNTRIKRPRGGLQGNDKKLKGKEGNREENLSI